MTENVVHLSAVVGRRRWPWKWGVLTLLCLGAHVALIWTLEGPLALATQRRDSGTDVQWITDSWALERLASLPGMHDPAVFALPALEGFSGSAWLTFKPLEPEFATEAADNHWLELEETNLGEVMQTRFTTNMPQSTHVSDLALPSLLGSIPQATAELVAPTSTVDPDGALEGRILTPLTNLPSWPNHEVLTNSVVQVLVDGDGQCLSSTLLSGCGSKSADAFALKWARTCRFKPVRLTGSKGAARDGLVSAKLTFRWRTIPVPSASGSNQMATQQ